jgi:hypothetical protein
MWSVVVGVRAPDSEGHSVTDMANLRALQADRSREGQYVHALRAAGDDGIPGDLAAVTGRRRKRDPARRIPHAHRRGSAVLSRAGSARPRAVRPEFD